MEGRTLEEQPGNQDEAFMNVTKTHKVSPVHLKVVNNVFPLNILIKKHPYTAMQRIMALLFHPPVCPSSKPKSFYRDAATPRFPSRRCLKVVLITVCCWPTFPGCFSSCDITFIKLPPNWGERRRNPEPIQQRPEGFRPEDAAH